ncbi:MAG: NAD(P)-binding protein [Propionicimonas sp.]
MAKVLEAAGVDALHVDMGCYEAWYKAIPTVYQTAPTQAWLAAEVRKVVSIPVLAVGKLNDPNTPVDAPRRALVVGGGPGGMEFAITAAERGVEGELWERTARLGGTLLAAGGPRSSRTWLTTPITW